MGKSALRLFLPLACGVAVLLAIAALGRWARQSLRQDERFGFYFAAIDCPPPIGLAKEEFLGEVQYLAGLPDRLSLLDEKLAERLKTGFARHPWVAQVHEVRIGPRRIGVDLSYREPVLAVMGGEQLRAVDKLGILLPASANTNGLPIYPGRPQLPAGPAGTPWGDPAVAAAARAASLPRSAP
jgi:hypothetical protein